MDAFLAVEGWVRAWAAPTELPAPQPGAGVGVRVSLYQQGRLVGWGSHLAEVTPDTDPLAASATDAMAMAGRVLLPRADALAAEQLRLLGADLTISLELAGPLTPLSEDELNNPDAVLRPGLDGLAVRVRGDWLVAFPSEILATATPAGVRLPAMAARLLGDPALGIELPVDLASRHGAAFYRFESVHIADAGRGRSAVFLHRGGSLVESREVTTAGLVRFAESLLAHAEATRLREPANLGLMGSLDAPRGVAEPDIATPMQQSLMALALLRLSETPKLPAQTREHALALARQVMLDLAVVEPMEIAPADDGVAAGVAWVVLSGLDADADETLGPLFATCESMLAQHAAAERAGPPPTVASAILVWALAERADRTGRDPDIAQRDLRALYLSTPPGALVGLMPWLGWAEFRLAGDAAVPSQAALRQVREQVWDHQLGVRDTGEAERDLAGGIVFTQGAASLPTWATAGPAALCATMLGDERLTTASEASADVLHLIAAMRFLEQLSARETECAFYPRADLARGGIRVAVWDHRMPPEATAMTMLAVGEFLRSLDTIERRKGPAELPPSR